VLINNTAINAYEHTLTGSPAVRAAFVLGISWYQLWRRREDAIDTVGPDRLVIVGSSVSLAGRWW
jgi:cytochrome d ubiquinol oxidase subunit I